ncbi:MAG TPA: dihydrofolate reductase [Flavobacteriales bacterium]|jgi:dihydrofolate reductase|nr:dihydrofolate reductase [Flavobacteriales bacterium]HIB77520.1 dihydrofolate reductase [Flavobacteriales bacterium]HIN41140.1 dihydrofolate reductase [Flavobacteriales bacterium]HIO15771.1 dihydrofolate reductase [Flavobacteriales bacterium]
MKVSLIAAVADNGVIGKDNDLVWSLPDDMSFFKASTRGRHVIMGRRNYESIPHKYRPLPGRPNIILSRNSDYDASPAALVTSLDEALEIARKAGETECFIIGGGQVYKMALDAGVIDTMFISHVHGEPEGDAFFPEFDPSQWTLKVIDDHPVDEKHAFSFTICQYDKK